MFNKELKEHVRRVVGIAESLVERDKELLSKIDANDKTIKELAETFISDNSSLIDSVDERNRSIENDIKSILEGMFQFRKELRELSGNIDYNAETIGLHNKYFDNLHDSLSGHIIGSIDKSANDIKRLKVCIGILCVFNVTTLFTLIYLH